MSHRKLTFSSLEGLIVGSMLAGVLSAPLLSQQPATGGPQLLTRAPEGGYILSAGDQLNIHVVDLDEYTDKTVRIDPDGMLDLPLIGRVQAGKQSLEEFRADLRTRLAKYVETPKVTVNLLTNNSSKVSIVGEVNSPGVRELTGPTTLLQAISEAGGTKPDAGPKVIVTRALSAGRLPVATETQDKGGTVSIASISLDDLMVSAQPADNILLRPGDIVSIPKAALIYVVGDVHRSGGYPISSRSSMTVIQAVSLAEGLTTNNAAKSARILRPSPTGDGKPIQIPVDIPAIFSGKVPDPNLFAQDILYIPHSTAEAGAKRAAEIALQVATGVLIYR